MKQFSAIPKTDWAPSNALNVPKTLAETNGMLSISAYDNLDYMEKKLFATIESIRARVGILSLSECYDSLPMWAHYADLAKGFVVIFENLELSFKGDETGSLNVPKPVVYTGRFIGMTFDPSTLHPSGTIRRR